MTLFRSFVLACAAPVLLVAAGGAQVRAAQEPWVGPRWELAGFDFAPDGVWRRRAREVARSRAALLASGQFTQLNAPLTAKVPGPFPQAVSGVLQVPVVLFRYNDTPAGDLRDIAVYRSLLFSTSPPLGRPYTYRTYFEELSNGLFSVQGQVYGYAALSRNEVVYTGGTSLTCQSSNPYNTLNCNGLFSTPAIDSMQAGLREALSLLDGAIDFSQYDADGNGIVDLAVFLHPAVDGACNTTHLWSHRFVLRSEFVTNDPALGGGFVRVRDYILQSGVGGATTCDGTEYMPVGTVAHETGHGLGLPDLYDTGGATEGIGRWGLMGAGNFSSANSPSRMEAWSLNELGWVSLAPISVGGTYSFDPAPLSDTAFVVQVADPNLRGEYFLLENRQAVQSDSALIRIHGGGGLLVWHVDARKIALGELSNQVNVGPVHGLALEEGDGFRQLWCEANGCNRGDGGDPYPGTSGNPAFSFSTTPPALTNVDSGFIGFALDSIRQVVPDRGMAFRLRFGGLTLVQANDANAEIQVDGARYNLFQDLFDDGTAHTIAVDATQLSPSGRTRFTFQSWSDGGAISHQITGQLAGATYTATLAKAHRLDVTVAGNGTVSYNPPEDSAGTFVPQGTSVTLTGTATSPFVFGGWTGDTTATNPVLTLPMGRPFNLAVRFDPQLIITSGDPRPGGLMGKPYADTLLTTGGTGAYTWQLIGGALPSGLTLAVNGRITGIPAQTGSFTFTLRVTSGAQQQEQQFGLTITTPTLATAAVVTRLLTGSGSLSADDLKYLDLLGNQNNTFDVGDFLAWVQATGATPAPPAIIARQGDRP